MDKTTLRETEFDERMRLLSEFTALFEQLTPERRSEFLQQLREFAASQPAQERKDG